MRRPKKKTKVIRCRIAGKLKKRVYDYAATIGLDGPDILRMATIDFLNRKEKEALESKPAA